MAIDKILPRSLNLDDDYLLVKSTEMADALNVSISTDDDGDAGVVKRAYGTELVPFAVGSSLPAGTNKVVGSCINREKNEILYAVYNSSGNHSIYLYSVATNTLSLVDRDSVWGFTADGWVKMDTIVKENGETLLYLNDGLTDPKKINVTKSLSDPLYPYKEIRDNEGTPIYIYTSDERLLSITTAKQPPLESPSVAFLNDPSFIGNNLKDNYFEFAYQYVYEDGEVSAISPYSPIALNQTMFFSSPSVNSSYFNAIDITVKFSLGDVSKVRILCRDMAVNRFFIVEEVDNVRSVSSTQSTVRFYNNKSRRYIQEREQNKLYDNVPKKALAQSIAANRLLYGGMTEFYDNVPVSANVSFNYDTAQSNASSQVTPSSASTQTSVSGAGFWFDIDLSAMSASLSVPSTTRINITPQGNVQITDNWTDSDISQNYTEFTTGLFKFNIDRSITLSPYANRTELANQIHPIIAGLYDGSSDGEQVFTLSGNNYACSGTSKVDVFYESFSANKIRMRFVLTQGNFLIFDPVSGTPKETLNRNFRTSTQTITSYLNVSSTNFAQAFSRSTFKRSQFHQLGVVYYDGRNRSGAVNPIGSFRADNFSDLFQGRCSANVRISSNAPSWAKRWQLVYAPYSTYSYMYSYSAAEAFTSTQPIADGRKAIYISLRHLEGKEDSYKESKGAIFNYSFVKGDRLRIVSYQPTAQRVWPTEDLDFEIIGLESLDSTNTVLSPTAGVSANRKSGLFLSVKDEGYTSFSSRDIENGTSQWDNNVIFEIYRPSSIQENSVYFEIGESYPVIYDSTSLSYKHKGQRDFQYSFNPTLPENQITVSDMAPYGRVGTSPSLDVRNGDSVRIVVPVGVFQTFAVSNVFSLDGKRYFQVPNSVVTGTYQVDAITNVSDAVVTTYNGDAYLKDRELKVNFNGHPFIENVYYETLVVEDLSINDFVESAYIGIGRSNAESEVAKSVFRKATIAYSDPYALDTSILGLSSFNLADANFQDLQAEHGAVRYIASNSDSIFVIQDTKCSVIPISRNVVEYTNGNASVTISNNFLGQQNFYAGDFGVGEHPESVAHYYGRVFFADHRTGKVIRISADGIEVISEQGMEAFFDSIFETVNRLGSSNFKIYGGIDPRNSEYVISIQKIAGAFEFENQTVGFSIDDKVWTTRYSYMPESMSEINGELYSMKNGSLYRHAFGAPRCRFYGQDFPSKLRIISSQNASMVKIYEAIGQESTAPWSFSCFTADQNTPVVLGSNMEKKEGFYYHNIPTDINKLNLFGIGTISGVTSVSAGVFRVTFSSSISYMPIVIGSTIYKISGSSATPTSYTITSVSGSNEITVSGSGALNTGEFLACAAPDSMAVDGEKLRGPYMVIDMEISGTSDSELYGVNVWFNRSVPHNEQVN